MNNKHIEKQAKELIEDHLSKLDHKDKRSGNSELHLAKEHSIISANLVRDQFLLAPQIEYWNKVIQAIKDYKYES